MEGKKIEPKKNAIHPEFNFKLPTKMHNEIIGHAESGHKLTDYKPSEVREAAHKAMFNGNIPLYHNLLKKARAMKIEEVEEDKKGKPAYVQKLMDQELVKLLKEKYPEPVEETNYHV